MPDHDHAPPAASLVTQYLREVDFALDRHRARLAEHPRHAAAAYLRAALASVRDLAALSRFDPRLLATAHAVLARITAAAREAEASCFAAGGNSAPYLTLLVALETWRIRLLVAQVQHEQRAARQRVPAPPATGMPNHSSAAPRRFVPADQGGRPRRHDRAP